MEVDIAEHARLTASEYDRLRQAATALARSLEHVAGEADETEHVHPETWSALRKSGLCDLTVPAAYGGRLETVDAVAVTMVREALMATSAHLDSLFAMQGVGSYALGLAGDERLRREWLPRVASLNAIAALALTEPGAGSDLKSIRTTVVGLAGETLVLSGHKAFITNAGDASFYTVLAREGDGYSLVFVPAESENLHIIQGPTLIAPHILGELHFDGVQVPLHYRIGAPGAGFDLALATLAVFRVSVAGSAVGLAQAALDEAVRHACTREQFGGPLWRIGAVGQLLARSSVDVETARAITYKAAEAAAERSADALHLSSVAKVAATETAGVVVDRCVQVMGRAGLVRGSKIERLYRNARPMRIYEGATEVILDSLARRLAKDHS